jgi:hypothetical protein
MKRKIMLSAIATALLATSASALKIEDYKIIEGTYQDAYLNGSLTIEGGNQDQTSYSSHVDATGRVIHNSAPFSWQANGLVSGDWSRGPNDSDETLKSYNATASTRFDKYIYNDDTWFYYGSGDLGYRKQVTSNDADDPFVKIGAGVGYGRMYDATALAKALRVVEDLTKYKIISAVPSDEAMIELARIINLEDEYRSKYGAREYKKYWYEDMEKIFKKAGVLDKDSLGAFGIVRINEIFSYEKIGGRFHGWKVRAGIGQILSNYDGESEDTTADIEFEYGKPYGYHAQFTERAQLSQVLDSSSAIDFQFRNTMSYTYELSDKIDWVNNWQLTHDAYEKGDDVTTNTLSTGFTYYLPNQLTFNATFALSKTDGTNGQSVETPDWDSKFYTGLTYRLK